MQVVLRDSLPTVQLVLFLEFQPVIILLHPGKTKPPPQTLHSHHRGALTTGPLCTHYPPLENSQPGNSSKPGLSMAWAARGFQQIVFSLISACQEVS